MFSDTTINDAASVVQGILKQRNTPLIVAAVLLVFLPFGNAELLFMVVGAAGYLILQALSSDGGRIARKKQDANNPSLSSGQRQRHQRQLHRTQSATGERYARLGDAGLTPNGWEKHPMPPKAPTLRATGWEAEVVELLEQITPSPACEAAVAKLALSVRQAIRGLHPDVHVMGYVSGNLSGGKACACRVAVPDVEIVATVDPAHMNVKKNGRQQWDAPSRVVHKVEESDAQDLQKKSLRSCIDRLVRVVGLKFRRSAFRGREPKVTFLLPATPGISHEAIPLDFFINSLGPLHNATLLEKFGQLEPSVKALTLLVKRWAKDRGICHAAKGHLPPYAWTILSLYYLQVGAENAPLLPPLGEVSSTQPRNREGVEPASVAELFKGFIRFYAKEFDWRSENASVALGSRGPRGDEAASSVVPSITDPFDAAVNLGDGMTAESAARLNEELARADSLCFGEHATLVSLLEPWKPAVAEDEEKLSTQ